MSDRNPSAKSNDHAAKVDRAIRERVRVQLGGVGLSVEERGRAGRTGWTLPYDELYAQLTQVPGFAESMPIRETLKKHLSAARHMPAWVIVDIADLLRISPAALLPSRSIDGGRYEDMVEALNPRELSKEEWADMVDLCVEVARAYRALARVDDRAAQTFAEAHRNDSRKATDVARATRAKMRQPETGEPNA